MKDRQRGLAWLNGLRASKDGERLGVCMAIDIHSESLPAEIFAEILGRVDLKIEDSRVAFARALEQLIDERFNCPSRHRVEPGANGDRYIRVLRMDDLVRYFMSPTSYELEPTAPFEFEHTRKKYFEDKDQLSLGEFDRCWSGKRERVWVLPRQEYERLQAYAAEASKALPTVLIDALGFGTPAGAANQIPELVAVLYPPEIPVHSAQPTAVDACWFCEGGFYLSYRNEDSWGRTHSSSGTLPPVKERVHPKIEKLTDEYVAVRLGTPSESSVDPESPLLDAYARAEKIWPKSKRRARKTK
jgi:hypothetical protein